MSELDVALELEKTLLLQEKPLRRCQNCQTETFRETCPLCGSSRFGAATDDELLDRLQKGEKIDLDRAFPYDPNKYK